MTRSLVTYCFVCVAAWSNAQPKQVSLGIFSGLIIPFTWDEGINLDARYQERYDLKLAPIGIHCGVDLQDFGFMVTPSLITVGQNYHVVNTVGGHEGTRKINTQYLQIPISVKYHVIDFSFFKVGLTGGVGVGFLLDGGEKISHGYAKFRFPVEVYPALPPDYVVEPDGVLAPKVENYTMLRKTDFHKLQWFASAGFRAEWDVSKAWRASLDVRGNYGFTETRTDAYLEKARNHLMIYDIAGKRREMFISVNIGISRCFEIDKGKEQKSKSFKKKSRR